MDVYKHSAFDRLEIVEKGRRRRWSDDEKLRIVMESQSAPRLVSATGGADQFLRAASARIIDVEENVARRRPRRLIRFDGDIALPHVYNAFA